MLNYYIMQPLKKNKFLEIKRKLINEFYSRYKEFSNLRVTKPIYKDQLTLKQINQKNKQSILNSNRSPCTAFYTLQHGIIPIKLFQDNQIKVNLVIQEVKNNVLNMAINSCQISKNKLTELFKGMNPKMEKFRISLKNVKKVFSQNAVIYLKTQTYKGEKGKITRFYENKIYFNN